MRLKTTLPLTKKKKRESLFQFLQNESKNKCLKAEKTRKILELLQRHFEKKFFLKGILIDTK